MITFFPMGALCNRLRALNSALALAKDLGRELRVLWFVRKSLAPFRFTDIFEPIDHVRMYENRSFNMIHGIHSKLAQEYQQIPIIKRSFTYLNGYDHVIDLWGYGEMEEQEKQEIRKYKHLFIKSSVNFYRSYDFSAIRPLPYVLDRVKKNTEQFDENTKGLHIRRGDRTISIYGSPRLLFEEVVEKTPRSNFYLATDDYETKVYFQKNTEIASSFFLKSQKEDPLKVP